MARRRSKNIKSRINRALEVPDEVALKVPKLTILKFEEVLIENYKGILEYQDFFVRIKTNIGIININGFKLTLEEMTIDDVIVKGKIESIDFESIVENEED
jgi:sporulation protein YqfC